MMNKQFNRSTLLATILGTTMLVPTGWADDTNCNLIGDVLPEDCVRDSNGVVEMPAGANTEFDRGNFDDDAGFVIAIDGEPLNSDPRVEDQMRRADIALADADLQVKFDGLTAERRLTLARAEAERTYAAGDTVTVRSQVNYPAYLSRAEIIVYELATTGGPKRVLSVPVNPNGSVSFTVPQGDTLVMTHRVYDENGRFDETSAVNLTSADARNQPVNETGTDMTARRGIPPKGGSITVTGENIRPGSQVSTLGETFEVDPNGRFAVQRVLPAGVYEVDVVVTGDGRNIDITRELEVPSSEWFYVGVADITIGRREGSLEGDDTFTRGRVQLFAKGTTESGYKITAALDTREGDLDELFNDLGARDPRTLTDRLADDRGYTVFGDDSSLVETAPTDGKVYLKIEREGNYFVWGNTQARIDGSTYLRNERTLYGAAAGWQTPDTTSNGDARAAVSLYASQTEAVSQRDVFQGTGGSVYFLSRNDILRGTDVLTVQVRDRTTGRVIETRRLVAGRDYSINYIQGSVVLTSPLTGTTSSGLVSDPSGDSTVSLVAQYEYAPTGGRTSDYAFGGRAEVWATDSLRFGVTATTDETGQSDQSAVAVDLRYRLGERSFVQLDYAESDGPGSGSAESLDAGLIFDSTQPVNGTGRAFKIEALIDFEELGSTREGSISGYFEDRTAGFSTLDYNVANDEQLYGFAINTTLSEGVRLSASFDSYEDETGKTDREAYVGLDFDLNDRTSLAVGVEHIDRDGQSINGNRTDVAARLTHSYSGDAEVYVFGQVTADASGDLPDNNRLGFGGKYRWDNGWEIEGEISDGDLGTGAKVRVAYNPDENRSVYFGYELDPARSFDGFGTTTTSVERSHYVVGGNQRINDSIMVYGENSYDLFGDQRSLASTYGVEFQPGDFTTYTASVEVGSVEDEDNGDFDRLGLSFGARYDDGEDLLATAVLEWRQDESEGTESNRDSETFAVRLSSRYKIDEEQRLLFSLEAVTTQNSQSSELDGESFDVAFGYARRPIEDDRLNLLLQYRYLHDEYGQQIDGVDELGPQQRSHIFSVDASYDLNNNWTIGGKLGARLGESRANENEEYTGNDAWLGIVNARYNITHEWDFLAEARTFHMPDAETNEFGFLVAGYRHFGNNWKVGVGYNFTEFSDDLSDLTLDDQGVFLNIVAKY